MARLAAGESGVVARRQLLAAGVSRHETTGRLASGLLTALYPGVYAVGCPSPSPAGAMWAAVLAGGATGALSHGSAAFRLDWLTGGRDWEITREGRAARFQGLRIYGVRTLRGEVMVVDGLRCTTPARTLVDLAAERPRRVIERCLDRWQLQGGYDEEAILAATGHGRKGSALIRRVLAEHAAGTTVTRNRFEERFLMFTRRQRIAQPQCNVPMTLPSGTPIVIDAWWPREQVAIELDGRSTHARATAFESDRARDLELAAMGITPGRVTWRKLTREPDWVERNVRALLSRSAEPF